MWLVDQRVRLVVGDDGALQHVTVPVERQLEAGAYKASSLSPVDPTSPAELVAVQLARGGKNSLYQKILPRFRAMLKSEK